MPLEPPYSEHGQKRWNQISSEQIKNYSDLLEALLLQRRTSNPVFYCTGECICSNTNCHSHIQREYDEIILCMVKASRSLPRATKGVEKDWWTSNLTKLREKSIAIQSLWVSEGRPRHGVTFTERLRVRAAYKHEIRLAKKAPKQEAWNKLHQAMTNHDTGTFWRRWRSIYGKNNTHFAPVVDGTTSKAGIANSFKCAFEKNSRPNNTDKVENLNARFKTAYREYCQSHTSRCDCAKYKISLEDTFEAIHGLNDGKSSDDDHLSAEHFKHAPLVLLIKLTALFNVMMTHGFVPNQFRFGTITIVMATIVT